MVLVTIKAFFSILQMIYFVRLTERTAPLELLDDGFFFFVVFFFSGFFSVFFFVVVDFF